MIISPHDDIPDDHKFDLLNVKLWSLRYHRTKEFAQPVCHCYWSRVRAATLLC